MNVFMSDLWGYGNSYHNAMAEDELDHKHCSLAHIILSSGEIATNCPGLDASL